MSALTLVSVSLSNKSKKTMKAKKILKTAIIVSLFMTLMQSAKAQTGIYVPELEIFDKAMTNL